MWFSQRVVCIYKRAATAEIEFSLLFESHTREDSQRISLAILGMCATLDHAFSWKDLLFMEITQQMESWRGGGC